MPAMPEPSSTASPRPFRRHALWLLLAFFLAISTLAWQHLLEKRQERNSAHLIHAWAEVGIEINALVHELQKERGISSGLLAAQGAQFNLLLRTQHGLTDRAIARLRDAIRNAPAESALRTAFLQQTLDTLDGLPRLRQQIGELRLSRDAAVDRYSELITPLFDFLMSTINVGRVGWIYRQQMAFISFMQAKEMAGQLRAHLTGMLSSGDFGPVRMAAFHRIHAVEQARLERFVQLADSEVQTAFQRLREDPLFIDVDRVRRLVEAIGASPEPMRVRAAHTVSSVSAEQWLLLSSRRLNALGDFEVMLGERLLNSARALETQAQRGLAMDGLAVFVSFLLAGILLFELWRSKESAEADLHLAAAVFGNSQEAIVITDARGTIVEVNDAFTRVTGYTREETLGRNPRLLKSGRQDADFYAAMWERILGTGHWEGEIWNRRKSGEIYPGLLSISPVKDVRGITTHYVAMTIDLSKYKETEALLEQLRTFDALTGLPNRDSWHSAVDQAVVNARRNEGRFAILDIGLDRFRTINESLGHAAGDSVLALAAERIKGILRRHDVAARTGGDRFSVLLSESSDARAIGAFCERLLAAFEPAMTVGETRLHASPSIGVALFPEDGEDTGALLQNSEVALHRAKAEGGSTYKFHSAGMNAESSQLLTLEQMMRQALVRREFTLAYQAQMDAASGRMVGCEALLRWHNETLGPISPVQFIPVAEATGLILPIGNWVLNEACQQAARWRTRFGADLPVAVNLSARQFRHEALLDDVRNALATSGLQPALLELEITEGLLINDPQGASRIMRGLRDMGVKIALDDFGTGYSSLAYLKTFPLDRLKLDRAFVKDLPDDVEDRAIARAVIGLGHNLGLQVLAEGVETAAQRDFLAEAGCDVFQGYFHGRPMAPAQFEEAIDTGTLPLARIVR